MQTRINRKRIFIPMSNKADKQDKQQQQMESQRAELQSFHCQLQRLFVYYCSFGDKDSYALLKIQNYQRLLSDMQLVTDPSLPPRLDLLFYSHSNQQSSLSFRQFTGLLPHICPLVLVDVPTQQQLLKLLSTYVRPLHDYILSQTDFGRCLSLISVSLLKQSSFCFLQRFQKGLSALYNAYFPKQRRSGSEQQFKQFTKLSRDLNFCPHVISKPISYLVFLSLTNRISKIAFGIDYPNPQTQLFPHHKFSFLCFIEYLIILSHINNPGQEQAELKIYQLLEQVEVSKGCQTLSRKVKFEHFFLLPDQLEEAIRASTQNVEYIPEKYAHQTVTNVEIPLKRQLGDYYDALKAKFVQLCGKKHAQSNFYLNFQTAKSLLTSLCPKLTGTVLQNMITATGKLNFQNFVSLLNNLSQKMNLPTEKLYEIIALYKTEQFNLSIALANLNVDQQEDYGCREVIKLSRSYLRSIYQFYQNKGSLTLNNYLKLFQETNVSPLLLSAVQVVDLFHVFGQNGRTMSLQQFQESLMGIVSSVHFEHQLQGVERLLYLLEKICGSKRGQMLMKKNILLVKEHPLYKVRVAFDTTYKLMQTKLGATSLNNIC